MSRTQAKQRPTVGVVGAGSFGLTVAQLLANSNNVLLFARDPQVVENINETRSLLGIALHPRITAISSFNEIA
ncbi:MAG: NAD-binding protein, partial [Saprospiraceae bacterium]